MNDESEARFIAEAHGDYWLAWFSGLERMSVRGNDVFQAIDRTFELHGWPSYEVTKEISVMSTPIPAELSGSSEEPKSRFPFDLVSHPRKTELVFCQD